MSQQTSDITTTEQTRLLNSTTTTSYTTSRQVDSGTTSQTVITMQHENGGIANGGSRIVSHDQYQTVIQSGQPKIPTHQLADKIQDILVFSEIKKKNQQQSRTIAEEDEAIVPEEDSPLKKKLSDWSLNGGGLRKRDLVVDALRFATDKWKDTNGYDQEQIVIQQQQQTKTTNNAESVFDVAKNASVCAVLGLLHEHKQQSSHSTETDMSLQALALSTLNLGLKAHDTSASRVVLYEMLTTKWTHGKSGIV
jgi:hypothetical protein